ncbi:MAG: type IV-A pilus assembly ATPase PilB, partial [Gammaproteobacteria bacterium]
MATLMSTPPLAGLTGVIRRLVMQGVVPEAEARKALETASKQKIPVPILLLEQGLASTMQLAVANSEEFGMPLLDAEAVDVVQLPMRVVSEELINQHRVMPLFKRGNRLFVGVADPTNLRA